MDLQISVFLLFILFTAGHSHICYECVGVGYCSKQLAMCPIRASKCESTTMIFANTAIKMKVKNCAVDCQNTSMNLGIFRSASTCCDTYFCNDKDAPDPTTFVPNGKKCYACFGKSCSNIVSCSGSEDHCVTATGTLPGLPTTVKGCVSKSFCNSSCSCMKDISCCEGDLCNGENGIIQSSKHDREEKVFQSVTEGFIQSVTQSYKYINSRKNHKKNMYDDAKSDKQSSANNGARRVTQSFLILCCFLLSFIMML